MICAAAEQFLAQPPAHPFDLVFLDPPYASAVPAECARLLERGWLAPDARVYLERSRRALPMALPANWRELRSGRAGEVGYHLFGADGEAPAQRNSGR